MQIKHSEQAFLFTLSHFHNHPLIFFPSPSLQRERQVIIITMIQYKMMQLQGRFFIASLRPSIKKRLPRDLLDLRGNPLPSYNRYLAYAVNAVSVSAAFLLFRVARKYTAVRARNTRPNPASTPTLAHMPSKLPVDMTSL